MAVEGILAPSAAPVRTATTVNESEPSSGSDHRRLAAKIIAGVAAAFALCVILVFVASLYVRWRRARRRNVDDESGSISSGKKRSLLCSRIEICNSGKLLNDTLSQTPKKHIHFAMRDLSIATNGFDETNILGEGGFGKVYRGVLSSPPFSKVAIKVLTGSTTQGVKEFVTEIEVLSRLDHKHLVRLLGSCMVDEQLLLVYRHVTNGSLSDHLHGDNGQIQTKFPWHMRVKIALGAALGVQHLHLQHPAVLHRDIKAANILLTRGFNAKVCDFGFAKFSSAMEDPGRFCCTPSRSGAIGTLGYVAPESMMTGEVSSASDVYSFGVVLLELLTGRKPLDFTKPDKDQSLVNWARNLLEQERIHELIDPSISEDLTRIRDSALLFLRMAKLCLDLDCQQRPTIGEVVQTLHVIKAEYESRPESVAITLSESDSASEVTADDTLSEISLGSDEDTNLVDIHDIDVDSFELHRSVKHFSSRYLDSDDCEGGFATQGGFSKSVRRCSSTPFTRPLSSSSWLSLGASSKPATPPRG